jgi:hypothetical protein
MAEKTLSRRDFLRLSALGVAGVGLVGASKIIKSANTTLRAIESLTPQEGGGHNAMPVENGNVGPDPLRGEGEKLSEFKNLEEARAFLEGQGGSQWIKGNAVKQLESFPWENTQAWTAFRNLKTTGDTTHFAFLVPKSDGSSYSLLGLEHAEGATIVDFLDSDGQPQAVKVMEPIKLKELFKKDYDVLSIYPMTVGPDFVAKDGSPNYIKTPQLGLREGFIHSTDGDRYHYFKAMLTKLV